MSTYITKYTLADGTKFETTTRRSTRTLESFCDDLTKTEFVSYISRDTNQATIVNTKYVATMEVTKLDD